MAVKYSFATFTPCKSCGREFVLHLELEPVSDENKSMVRGLLLERISLRGICRVLGVSLAWLIKYMVEELFDRLPEHVHLETEHEGKALVIQRLEAEVDEMFSFVGCKQNKQWIWEQPTRLRVLWGGSPLPSIARFGRLAYPMRMKVTTCVLLGRKRHGCPTDTEPQRWERPGWQANLEA